MANNDYITTDCKLTVSKNTAKLDEEIFLYKNDRNIKLLIEIVDNKYRYKSDDLSNLLVKYKASYAQVKWYKNAEVKKEFPIQATDDGKVVFVIEGQLIDEDTELGDYDLQLRLLNESQESIRSLPIIKGAVHILKPLFEEGDIATVNSAVADISMLSLDGDAIDTYNSDGTYNQTNWGNGDVISSAKLNKLEKVAKDNVDKVNKMPAKSIVEGGKIYLAKEDGTKIDSGTELPAGGTGTPYDDTQIKTDINTIKTDLGTEELTTTAKDVKGAINEVNKKIGTGGEVVLTPDTDSYRNDLFRANPAYPLNIKTHAEGKDQPTHPKVLYKKDKWNGYKYWMVYTPYPSNINYLENPCIQVSNNGYEWEVPSGLTNPIDSIPEDERGNFYSDPHILINSNNEMECWYRKCIYKEGYDDYGAEIIYRKKSTNGVIWTEKEELYRHSSSNVNLNSVLSPSVIYDENKYKIWIIATENGKRKLKYYETTTGSNWEFIRDIEINDPDGTYNMWHFDIIKSTEGYEFVGAYQRGLSFNQNNYIFYSKSDDNITYSTPIKILGIGYEGNFDDLELYRPCLIRKANELMMYYGAQKNAAIWHIGLIRFNNFTQLSDALNGSSEILDLRNTLSKQQASINDLYEKINALNGSSKPTTGIVTDGLICCLDATDKSNVSADRSIWKDSSGQINNAELFNFTYDISDSNTDRSNGWTGTSLKLGKLQNTYITVPVTNAACIQMKIKLSVVTSGTTGQYIMDGRNDIPNSFLVNTPATASASSVGSLLSQKFYVNGIKKTSPHINMLTSNEFNNLYIEPSSTMTGTLTFGAKSEGKGECATFEIEKILIYDRALTESELLQNQNAM